MTEAVREKGRSSRRRKEEHWSGPVRTDEKHPSSYPSIQTTREPACSEGGPGRIWILPIRLSKSISYRMDAVCTTVPWDPTDSNLVAI